MFGRLLRWYTMYAFWGLLPSNAILPGAKFTLRPSPAFSLAALLNGFVSDIGIFVPNRDVNRRHDVIMRIAASADDVGRAILQRRLCVAVLMY